MASHAFSSAFGSGFNIEVAAAAVVGGTAMFWTPINRFGNRDLPRWLLVQLRREPAKTAMLLMKYMQENTK